jgi:hypothetical protein
METKKIVAIIAGVLFLAALGLSLAWAIINFDKVKQGMSGAGLYTQDDVDNSYADGYDTALDNKAEYEALIAEYRDKLSEYENIKKELTVAKYNIAELNGTVDYLKNYIAECEQLIKNLTAENFMLKDKVKILEEIKTNLMQSVNAYVQLIASISLINERFVVTFMFDDTVYSILLVPDGAKVELVNPTSTEYTIFLGWSLSQNGDLIDLENLEISQDTVLYAKIIRKYDVNFILDYAVYEHRIVERGDTVTAMAVTSTQKRVFMGWSLDGVTVIDVTNYAITEHRNFFAVVETRYEVRFVYTRHYPALSTTTLSTQYVGAFGGVTVPTAPTLNGYTFSGWLLNGVTSTDPTAHTVTSDSVFVARYVSISGSISSTHRFSTSGLYGQYSLLSYLSSNGYGYINNMQMLKSFSVTVRVYAGNHNGATYTLTQNNFSVYRVSCAGFSELLASGTLFYSVSLAANGFVQMQLTFEGTSLVSSSIFSGSCEIVGMSFTLVDF